MATTLDITTNYVGEVAGGYIAEMIKEANTISENLVTVLPNIVSPEFIRKVETEDGYTDYSCGFTPAGSVTLSEKQLVPKKIKEDREFCKEEFRQLWTAQEMGFSAHNDNGLPATEQTAILADMGKRLARKLDQEIWNGDGSDGKLAGFIPAFEADADVIDVAGSAIAATNVETELGKFIDAHTDEMLQAEAGHVFGVSTNVIRAIKRAYGTQARSNGTFLNPNEFDFEGYTLTEIKGLPASTMVGYNKNNLFFGTGLLADMNDVRIKDMDESLLTGQIRTKVVLTGGVQYAWGGEVVLYQPTV